MSDLLYRRSLGYPVDEDAVQREAQNGFGPSAPELAERPDLSGSELLIMNGSHMAHERSIVDVERDVMRLRVEETILDLELEFHMLEEQMAELAEIHPKYTWRVGQVLSERLDQLKDKGHPVDAEMYVEADLLAEEIVNNNPDMNEQELLEVVATMVAMIKAEYQMHHVSLVA